MYLAEAQAGLLDLSLSFVVEAIVFVVMIAALARWAYPPIIRAAEARQRAVASELEAAEKAHQEAEERVKDAQGQLDKARANALDIIAGANKSADQLRSGLTERASEEAKRISERARQDIEAERQKAVDSVRQQVAALVVEATERVVGETLDPQKHRKLIEQAIDEVGAGRG